MRTGETGPGGARPSRRRAIAGLVGAALAGGAVAWPLRDEKEWVPVVPAADGPLLWTTDVESADETFFGPGTTGGLLLVEQPSTGRRETRALSCLDVTTGRRLWSMSLAPSLGDLRQVLVTGAVVLVRTEAALQAIDLRTGRPIWRHDRKTPEVISSIVLAGAGLVLDGGKDQTKAEFSPPYTVEAYEIGSGRLRWATEIRPAISTQRYSIHAAGLLLGTAMTSGPPPAGNTLPFLYAVDAPTGRQRWWRRLSDDDEFSQMTSAYAGGAVFVSLDGRVLVALEAATGAVRWRARFRLRASGGRDGSGGRAPSGADIPVPAGDTVYLCGADGVLRAFDVRNGRQRWDFALGEEPAAMGAVPARPRPVTENGLVYVTSVGTAATDYESTMHVLGAADGRPRWRRPARNSPGGPVMFRGAVHVPDEESVTAYDPSRGTVRQRLDLKALNLDGRSIELVTDGVRLYVLARNQVLALSPGS